ncbi:MAG: MOSC domain-containing protein [Candidatus Nitrohelix vancouverensis]|uniref:MOSC domain-containing protein n=1 Tax=Candidatus Nitrohelix vancouverensis TaxID=2705534 RepID=A0A7T0G3X4_9BACT|nr:MAG: MOSC domain-containing protein [Candidatus Nitrohelix vancouverensis]
MITLLSVNVGKPKKVTFPNGRTFYTGFNKTPTSEPQYLDAPGLIGDGVADRRYHGGSDKAVCVYFADHFAFWKSVLGVALSPGSFGENFSISGMDETQLHIGDIYRVGDAELQCTEPRQPCVKLASALNSSTLVKTMRDTGYSGAYFSVLKPGQVRVGDSMELITADPEQFSISQVNQLLYHDKSNTASMQKLLAIPGVSTTLRRYFEGRLEKSL